jgi:MED7 protein
MQVELSTAFPFPPKFYKDYTDENIKRWNETEDKSTLNLDPPEMVEGPIPVFGKLTALNPLKSLTELGFNEIRSGLPPKEELKLLVQALMTTFKQLLDVLATDTNNVR